MRAVNEPKTCEDDRPGAVTVDWVVMTLAVLGIGIAVLASISTGSHGRSANGSDYLVDTGRTGAF